MFCRPATRRSCLQFTKRSYNTKEAVHFFYVPRAEQTNEPKNVHRSIEQSNAMQCKAANQPYALETSSLVLTATGSGMTVRAIPGHQYRCSRSTPGSCHMISGCFRRRGGALASALSALK
jgi:hypothetical protein